MRFPQPRQRCLECGLSLCADPAIKKPIPIDALGRRHLLELLDKLRVARYFEAGHEVW